MKMLYYVVFLSCLIGLTGNHNTSKAFVENIEASQTKAAITSAEVKFSKISGAEEYIVEATKDGNVKRYKSTNGIFYMNDLESGATYSCMITAYANQVACGNSTIFTVITTSVPPSEKRQVECSPNSVTLSWSKVKETNFYLVYRIIEGGELEIMATENLSFIMKEKVDEVTVKNIVQQGKVTYHIVPVRLGYQMFLAYGSGFDIVARVAPEPPATKVSQRSVNRVYLSFGNKQVEEVAGYQVEYRKLTGKTTVSKMTTNNNILLSWDKNSCYRVRVRAYTIFNHKKQFGLWNPIALYGISSEKKVYRNASKSKITCIWHTIAGVEKYKVYVSKENENKYIFLKELTKNEGDISFASIKGKPIDKRATYYIKVIPIGRIGTTFCESDLSLFYKSTTYAPNIVNERDGKYSYLDMKRDLFQFEKVYGSKIKVSSIGKSYDQRELYCIRLGDKNKPVLVVAAAIHGREYLNTKVLMEKVENLLQENKEQLKTACIYILPMINPDGVEIAQYGIKKIQNKTLRNRLRIMKASKAHKKWKSNARGVDLNRNFSSGWGHYKKSNKSSGAFFPGKHPDSEKETRALIQFMKRTKHIKLMISYHSAGNLLYSKYNVTGQLRESIRYYTNAIANSTNYYKCPAGEYTDPNGGFGDWTVYHKRIPSITIETKHSGFYSVLQRNQKVIELLLKKIGK